MGKRIIYLLRHAEPSYPEGMEKTYIGQSDIPLSDKGRREAEKTALYFSGVPIEAIYSSDLIRAYDTAKLISEITGHKKEIRAVKGFREINLGSWDGVSMDKIKKEFPEEYEKRGRSLGTYRTPGGESFSDVYKRAFPALKRILEETSGNILICSHAGTNRIILSNLLKNPPRNLFRIPQNYGGINILSYGQQIELVTINYLPGKGEYHG